MSGHTTGDAPAVTPRTDALRDRTTNTNAAETRRGKAREEGRPRHIPKTENPNKVDDFVLKFLAFVQR